MMNMKQVYIVKRSSYSREPSGAFLSFERAASAAEAFGQSALDVTAVPLLDTPGDSTTVCLGDLDDSGLDPMAKGVPDAV